jgi:hypothetical protein
MQIGGMRWRISALRRVSEKAVANPAAMWYLLL